MWSYVSNPTSPANIASLKTDYEFWRNSIGDCDTGTGYDLNEGIHANCNCTHIPWKYFKNYDDRQTNMTRDDKLKDWIKDRPELWNTVLLRQGGWSEEDINLLLEFIDLTAGIAF